VILQLTHSHTANVNRKSTPTLPEKPEVGEARDAVENAEFSVTTSRSTNIEMKNQAVER